MTVRKKLKIGMGIPLVIFFVFAVISYLQTRWIGRCLTRVTEVEAPKSEAASRMEIALSGIGFQLLGYMRDHDAERLERISGYKEDFRRRQDVYCLLAKTREAEMSAIAVERGYAVLRKIVEELINVEDYQVQRLSLLDENFKQTNRLLKEELEVCTGPEEDDVHKRVETLVEMMIRTDEIRENLGLYLKTHQEQYENRVYENQEGTERFAGVYKDLAGASERGQLLEQLGSLHVQRRSLVKEIVALDGKKKAGLEQFVRKREGLRLVLGHNVEKAAANLEDAKRTSYRAVNMSTIVSLILVSIGLVVALISQAYIAYIITAPITRLRDAAIRISQGRYDKAIGIESDDELGQLADSIGKIAEELERTKGSRDAVRKGAGQREKARMTL